MDDQRFCPLDSRGHLAEGDHLDQLHCFDYVCALLWLSVPQLCLLAILDGSLGPSVAISRLRELTAVSVSG